MEAGKKSISDIFNGNRILEIPFFQRAYVWGEEEWKRFLEDMEFVSNNKEQYFLGSIILKQQLTSTSESAGDIRTLIDGQQRLTTLNMFFKVLYLMVNENDSFNRTFKLKDGDLALSHNHNDKDSFEKVLNFKNLEGIEKANKDNILLAYQYFIDEIEERGKHNFKPQNILNKVMFVCIDLGAEEDEQQIFDTINSLGVRLTTAELLKNALFKSDELSDYKKYWQEVFEKDSKTKKYWDKEITTGRLKRTFIDLFLYAYLQIKIQDPNLEVKHKEEFSRVDNLFGSYKKFIEDYYKVNKIELLEELKSYAELFRHNFDKDIVNKALTAEAGIERINAIIFGLEHSTLIPYVLFILNNVTDENDKNELFGFIESYVMRRIICKETTKNYNKLFTENLISNSIDSKIKLQKHLSNIEDKINYLPDDKELKNGFHSSKLINKQARGIIYFTESKIREEKHSNPLNGLDQYSLEHLMPKKWQNHWKNIPLKEDEKFRDSKLLTLGNLAIIKQRLNSTLSDSDWETKKIGKGKQKGLKYYSGSMETLSKYLELEQWNEEEIEKRANFLFEEARKIWKVE